MLNRLASLRRARNLSQQALADRVGTGKSQIVKLERGERRLDVRWIERLSLALEVPPQALLVENEPGRVAIVGYVGAGARIYPPDLSSFESGFGGLVCPPGLIAEETGAALIKGDSMPPMAEGWGLFWRLGSGGSTPTEMPEDCIGRLCVVQVADEGFCCVKKLRPGYMPGRFNLLSTAADPIEDVKIEWVARVRLAVPQDELEFLE